MKALGVVSSGSGAAMVSLHGSYSYIIRRSHPRHQFRGYVTRANPVRINIINSYKNYERILVYVLCKAREYAYVAAAKVKVTTAPMRPVAWAADRVVKTLAWIKLRRKSR